MGCGRFVCVAVPFLLTLASLVALLVAGLAGVADKNLWMFEVNTTDLSISPSDAAGIVSARSHIISVRSPEDFGIFHDPGLLNNTSDLGGVEAGGNITAADLGLLDLYQVSLWGFCYVEEDGTKGCTKAAFNWAQDAFNGSEKSFDAISTLSGGVINVPKAVTDAINSFTTAIKWTEIVFIIACVALGVELFFGFFAECSRAFSCITFLIALIATVAVGAAAGLSTAISSVLVGAIEASGKNYGVKASLNTGFLAAVWASVLFALAAALFWVFTICCCAPDHHSRGSRRSRRAAADGEKLLPTGAYQPLHEPEQQGLAMNNYSYAPQYAPRYPSGAPRSDLAYEPYSHANV